MKIVADNRKARHEYHVLETLETGIVLTGTEVKSARAGHVSLSDAYALIQHGEMYLHHVHIAAYAQGNRMNHDPYRPRKLLAKRAEIDFLYGRMRERGLTIIPLRFFFSDRGWAKVEVGLCRGKKLYDKRQDLKERDARREMERALKSRQR